MRNFQHLLPINTNIVAWAW